MRAVRGLFGLAMLSALVPLGVSLAQAEPVPGATVEAVPVAIIPAVAASTEPATTEAPIAAVKPAAPPKPVVSLVAQVDLTRQIVTVLERGKPIHSWKISSGVEEHPTPTGTFQPEWSAKMWYSRTYDDAPMPHAVFFKNGAAIHATQATGALGRAASHGCVRLAPTNAEIFYKLVQRHGLAQVRISVFGKPAYARPMVANRGETLPRRPDTPSRNVQYATSSAFAVSPYPYPGSSYRLPISAARLR